MKRLTAISLFLSICSLVFAQGAAQSEIISAIIKSGSEMKSLECDFVQKKHSAMFEKDLVSRGRLYFCQPDKLRMEMFSPTPFTFVLNGGKAMVCKDGKASVMDAGSNRMVKEMSKMLLGSISGQNLSDSKTFSISASEDGGLWKVIMVPLRKELKQVWTDLVMTFDPEKNAVIRIEINECSSDITSIELGNVHKNGSEDDSLFTIKSE